ncbi:hypothetical protein ACIGB8_22450 [Promicromonospora sukumoe]|uniref:hypothetical protein n=1 Tax=Promicromonospora sukumoe TaxID=88382 RepID=UPI0037C77CDF
MSEADFVAGAVEVAGLTASAARAAYADPELAATIPVAVETGYSVSRRPIGDTGAGDGARSAANFACEVSFWRANVGPTGDELMRYTVDKYFESDGTNILNWDVSEAGTVTYLGQVGGWSFRGTLLSTDGDRAFGSAHYSQRVGEFQTLNSFSWTPELQVIVHANGDIELFWPGERDSQLTWC